jgi:hypothetical protein
MRQLAGIILSFLLLTGCGTEEGGPLLTPTGAGGQAGTGGSGGGVSFGGRERLTSCKTSDDCSASMPVCDEKSGTCVACLFDSQCASDQRCSDQHCETKVGCKNSLDCNGNLPICDTTTNNCEQCINDTDCEGEQQCIAKKCTAIPTCTNSLDCNQNQVCNTTTKLCVDCVSNKDCTGEEVCINDKCITQTSCVSDKDCKSQGKLCNFTTKICVECLQHSDCPADYYCSQDQCKLDLCQQGQSKCQNNQVVTCSTTGDQFLPTQTCSSSETCIANGNTASCQPLSCTPGKLSCNGNNIQQCDASGQTSTTVQTCSATQYCQDGQCKTQLCSPSQPVCNGSMATTCNAEGSGYSPGGTNCATAGKTCKNGSCSTTCPAGYGALDSLRLTEIMIGQNDYVVLKNVNNTCSLDLAGIAIQLNDSSNTHSYTFPSKILSPKQSLYLIENNGSMTDDIVIPDSIYWNGSSGGGHVMLCKNDCSSSANVIDAAIFKTGTTQPQPFGNGATMIGGYLSGITTNTEGTMSWKRVAFTGSTPNFQATDWTVGSATRPDSGQSATCPSIQPQDLSTCSQPGLECSYGITQCTCDDFFGWWSCI